jgi:tRNA pseudouridine65 synthase
MKHISHPIVGDVNYGKGDVNRHYRARYALRRLALHAHLIGFHHPTTGARVVVRAPLGDALSSVLAALQLPVTVEALP